MNSVKTVLLCVMFLFSFNYVCAHRGISFEKVEGTISNVIYCILQDSKGYIWIGTESGVSRYDGYGFRHFTKDDGLSDNDIFQIKEDSKGRLWFLTYTGEPSIYDHGIIRTPKNASFLKDISPGSMATGFIEKGDTIAYITYKKIYLLVKDKLVSIVSAASMKNVKGNQFFLSGLIRNGKIFFVTNVGMHSLDQNTFIPFPREWPRFNTVATKMFIRNNTIVLVSAPTVSIINIKGDFFVKSSLFDHLNPVDIAQSNDPDIIWILTDKGVYNLSLSKKTIMRNETFDLPSLSSLLYDKEGNLWAGSLNQGLYFSANSKVHQYNYVTTTNIKAAYSLALYDNDIYAGFSNHEFVICNRSSGNSKRKMPVLPIQGKVYGFTVGKEGIWVVTGKQLVQYDADGRINRSIENTVKITDEDEQGNLYIGHSTGVVKADLDKIKKTHISAEELDSISTMCFAGRVNSILCTGNDSVWLGALNGIHLLVKNKEVHGIFPGEYAFRESVTRVINTPYGIVFSTSGEGLVILAKDSTYILNHTNGMISNVCNSVFAAKDTLWVGTASGLARVIGKNNNGNMVFSFKNYTTADGLASNKINDVVVNGDTVWAATENGVCYFNAGDVDHAFPAPGVIIQQMLVNGHETPFDIAGTLPHDSNSVQIKFTGISFYSKGALTYKYKLEGADNDWHYTTLREVQYPSLQPGKYKFLLMAANADSVWNTTPAMVQFEIIPPYWQTWWFVSLVVIAVVIFIYLFIRYRFEQQRKNMSLVNKALLLEKENAEYEKQLIELEQQALRLQMNPHFIFNAMTAVQGLYAAGKIFEAKEYLGRFSRMLRSIFEITALPAISISRELELVTDYIELTTSKLNYKIHYSIQCNVDEDKLAISPLLLQPFVENALVHGLLPLKKEGNLSIKINKQGGKIIYEVEDNGKGISDQPYSRNEKPRGLSVTAQRIALLNKTGDEETFLRIEPVSETNGTMSGTRVIFITDIMYLND